MGRKRKEDAGDFYKIAIRTAREIVVAEGHKALTARNVAKLSGYTAGSIYNHFSDFKGLIGAVNAATIDEILAETNKVSRAIAKPKKRIRALAVEIRTYALSNPALWELLRREEQDSDRSVDYLGARRTLLRAWKGLFKDCGHGGKASSNEAELLWIVLSSPVSPSSAEALVDRQLVGLLG